MVFLLKLHAGQQKRPIGNVKEKAMIDYNKTGIENKQPINSYIYICVP